MAYGAARTWVWRSGMRQALVSLTPLVPSTPLYASNVRLHLTPPPSRKSKTQPTPSKSKTRNHNFSEVKSVAALMTQFAGAYCVCLWLSSIYGCTLRLRISLCRFPPSLPTSLAPFLSPSPPRFLPPSLTHVCISLCCSPLALRVA
eukprot:1909546-Rhodomonas_salina.4